MVGSIQLRRWLFVYWLRKQHERLLIWISWHLPRSVVYWCFVRVYAHATTGKHGNTHPDEVGYGEVARRWGEANQ